MTRNSSLRTSYKSYQKRNKAKRGRLEFFRAFMPEIIFRTTKLEGESVTRKLVRAIFS